VLGGQVQLSKKAGSIKANRAISIWRIRRFNQPEARIDRVTPLRSDHGTWRSHLTATNVELNHHEIERSILTFQKLPTSRRPQLEKHTVSRCV
jgi:hypothetical protein